jgi:hypothetical protein
MSDVTGTLPWNLCVELRKEIISTQALRSRTIELKIIVVGGAIGLYFTAPRAIGDPRFLAIPAFVSIFFDFLIASYSFAIKRKGRYIESHIEPQLKTISSWSREHPLWEEHLRQPAQRQRFSLIANVGFSLLACLIGTYVLARPPWMVDAMALLVMWLLFGCVTYVYANVDYHEALEKMARMFRRKP